MSLLMLKTKNLTHQDHILNFELMLNPNGSGLLMNKHRSLESKRDKEKEICEVEKEFAVRRFNIDKRLIERRRAKLLERAGKRTYYTPRSFSSMCVREPVVEDVADDHLSDTTRATSAPTRRLYVAGRQQAHKKPVKKGRDRPSTSKQHVPFQSTFLNKRPHTTSSGREQNTISAWSDKTKSKTVSKSLHLTKHTGMFGNQVSRKKETEDYTKSRNIFNSFSNSKNTKSTSFRDDANPVSYTFLTETAPRESGGAEKGKPKEDSDKPVKPNRLQTALATEANNSTAIKGKVCEFLGRVEDFKVRPAKRDAGSPGMEPWVVQRKHSSATVAKRYNQLALDVQKLNTAFDKLCVEKNPEELQKIVKLASKLKSSVKYARNVSMVPVMGTLKSGKRFMENVLSKQQ